MVKSSCCPCRGPRVRYHYPHTQCHNHQTEDCISIPSDLHRDQTYQYTYTHGTHKLTTHTCNTHSTHMNIVHTGYTTQVAHKHGPYILRIHTVCTHGTYTNIRAKHSDTKINTPEKIKNNNWETIKAETDSPGVLGSYKTN